MNHINWLQIMKSSKSETLFYVPTVCQIRTFQFNTNDVILTPFHQHQWAYFLCNFDLFCSWRGQINFIYYKFLFFLSFRKSFITECNTCVVLPLPVSPTSTRIWWLFRISQNFSLYSQTGSIFLLFSNSKYFGVYGKPER